MYPKIHFEEKNYSLWATTVVRFSYNGVDYKRHIVETIFLNDGDGIEILTKIITKCADESIQKAVPCMFDEIIGVSSDTIPSDLIELQNQWLEDGDQFEGKDVDGRYAKVYVSRKELELVHKQQRRG